jgi:hypothetical protein
MVYAGAIRFRCIGRMYISGIGTSACRSNAAVFGGSSAEPTLSIGVTVPVALDRSAARNSTTLAHVPARDARTVALSMQACLQLENAIVGPSSTSPRPDAGVSARNSIEIEPVDKTAECAVRCRYCRDRDLRQRGVLAFRRDRPSKSVETRHRGIAQSFRGDSSRAPQNP